ncbi:amino acid ABC transporter permease [Falsirhodobacter xinxiangensis]|uniref:amino acid ABC transporter permease n=1 Tax=Falsirhodobacter xinxiangensis TaxID=2530049 RepID=UPI0010A9B783|nr:ABC transporter permease subunit [Rhodobacter xinxiangensis]
MRLLRDARVRGGLIQIALLAAVACVILWIANNTAQNLSERGIRTGWDFLDRPARFPISESVLPYDPQDSFLWAYVVGLGNTLWISALAIFGATVLGLGVGLAGRSSNPLLGGLGAGYVTVMRNLPLIVQLLFWYALATAAFPAPRAAWEPIPGVFLTQRGIFLPALPAAQLALAVALGLVAAMLLRRWRAVGGVAVFAATLILTGATVEVPELRGFTFRGGIGLSPEFAALMLGIILYTAAFVGEIIRGGIDAVAKGQWEAGRALGLTDRTTLRRIILPQALRVIIPPMTSQYLSTVKNTTLALAVGYPELGLVVNTVINQTGQAIESLLILLGVFLTISLSVSLLMNWYNARMAIVVR